MILAAIFIILSLVILYFAAEWLVRGGTSLAQRLGVSPLIIGLTIVSFGTSAPELVVSIQSSVLGQGALSIGNVLGSNLFNIGVILGISAIIYPLAVKRQLFKLDIPVVIVATLLFFISFHDGKLVFAEGLLFLILFFSYIGYLTYKSLKENHNSDKAEEASAFRMTKHWGLDILLIIVGLLGLVYGSDMLVKNSTHVARHWGMSEALIGLTIVAAGTSMPELATSVVAAMKKHSDIAVGNVIGSNIFNILLVMGAAGVINPIETDDIKFFDGAFLLFVTFLLYLFMKKSKNVTKAEGAILLLSYIIYFIVKLLIF